MCKSQLIPGQQSSEVGERVEENEGWAQHVLDLWECLCVSSSVNSIECVNFPKQIKLLNAYRLMYLNNSSVKFV